MARRSELPEPNRWRGISLGIAPVSTALLKARLQRRAACCVKAFGRFWGQWRIGMPIRRNGVSRSVTEAVHVGQQLNCLSRTLLCIFHTPTVEASKRSCWAPIRSSRIRRATGGTRWCPYCPGCDGQSADRGSVAFPHAWEFETGIDMRNYWTLPNFAIQFSHCPTRASMCAPPRG